MLKSLSNAARALLQKQEIHNASKAYFYNSNHAAWSDKDYSNFAQNAYINNVIAHRAINNDCACSIKCAIQVVQAYRWKETPHNTTPSFRVIK